MHVCVHVCVCVCACVSIQVRYVNLQTLKVQMITTSRNLAMSLQEIFLLKPSLNDMAIKGC